MTTKIVEGVEYISEDIPGKGVCLVPKVPKVTYKLQQGDCYIFYSTCKGTLMYNYGSETWSMLQYNKFATWADFESLTEAKMIEKLLSAEARFVEKMKIIPK